MAKPLTPSSIEHIHDVLVATVLPYDEKILPNEYRNRSLIESAAGRPFQTAFGEEVFPTLASKAAALFHALVCNHCFFNGNKRTAVVSLDLFLAVNRTMLILTSDEVYEMAKMTAKANETHRSLAEVMTTLTDWISRATFDVDQLKAALAGEDSSNRFAQTSAASIARMLTYLNAMARQVSGEESPLL